MAAKHTRRVQKVKIQRSKTRTTFFKLQKRHCEWIACT